MVLPNNKLSSKLQTLRNNLQNKPKGSVVAPTIPTTPAIQPPTKQTINTSNNQQIVNRPLTNNTQPFTNQTVTAPTVDPRWNSNQTVPDYLGMTPDMIKSAFNGLTSAGSQYYNPDSDPVYKSMVELSQKQADKAGLQAMEQLNERGILNSAITTDRLGQIKQGASDAVLSQIPSLANAFNNRQAQNSASMQNLIGTLINAGQYQQNFAEGNRRYDEGFAEDNRRYDKQFSLDEAAVTGRYLSPEAQNLVQQVLNAKGIRENKTNPVDQRDQAHMDANAARQQLAAMGVDISMLGADSSYRQALNALSNLGGAGITTMNNRQQQMTNALATGEMTGNYTPAGTQNLVNELLRLKQENEKGGISGIERQSNTARATQIRNQLAGLGINADSLFGAGVGAQQAASNVSRMAVPTEQRRQFNTDLAMRERQMAQDMALKRDQFAFDQSSFNREMNFKEQNALIDADLRSRGLDLESAALEINQFAKQSEAEYQKSLNDSKINEQTAKQNTNTAIAEALKASTSSEALAFLAESASGWAKQGVDMKEVLGALQMRFPDIKEALGSSSGSSAYPTP